MKKPFLEANMFTNVSTKYEADLYLLYKSENPIDTLKKFNWDRKTFEKVMSSFANSKKYKDCAKKYVEYFTYLYNEYSKKYGKEVKKEQKTKTREEIISAKKMEAARIIISLTKSGLSINEYASENLYCDINDLRMAIKELTTNDDDRKKLENVYNALEKPSFRKKINYILNEIEMNEYISSSENFDIVDYFLNTSLSLIDFKKIVGRSYALSKFMSKYSECTSKVKYRDPSTFREIKIKESDTKVNGVEISENDKEQIFMYMEENQIPYTSQTYSCCIKRYIEGRLEKEKRLII